MLPIVEWKDGQVYGIYAPFSMVELGRYGNKAVLTGSKAGLGFGDSIFWVGFLTWADDQGTDGKFSHQTVTTIGAKVADYWSDYIAYLEEVTAEGEDLLEGVDWGFIFGEGLLPRLESCGLVRFSYEKLELLCVSFENYMDGIMLPSNRTSLTEVLTAYSRQSIEDILG